MEPLAPICLFAYNRPGHLQRTLQALCNNTLSKDSDLFVFSDGAKRESDREKVEETRAVIRSLAGFRSITPVERGENWGLAASVINGVTRLVEEHGKVIVLEDDIVTSPYFLQYMNDALDRYAEEETVGAISGFLSPIEWKNQPETFFARYSSSWGWGTWKRAWRCFRPDGRALLREIQERGEVKAFNVEGSYPFDKMLKEQNAGKNDSWAIRWYASLFLQGMLTLHPGHSLVQNIGHDGSGTHCGSEDTYNIPVENAPVKLEKITPAENREALRAMSSFYKKNRGICVRIKRKLKKISIG